MKYFICPKCGEMLDPKLAASLMGHASWEKNKVTARARLKKMSETAAKKRWALKKKL